MADDNTVTAPTPTAFRARDREGEFTFTLPVGARLTFGPDVPMAPRDRNAVLGGSDRVYALRIYGGKGNETLVACFPHVEWFRPADLPYSRVYDGPDGMQIDVPIPPTALEGGVGLVGWEQQAIAEQYHRFGGNTPTTTGPTQPVRGGPFRDLVPVARAVEETDPNGW